MKAGAAAGLWWLCVPCAPWAAAIGTGGHHRLLLSQDEHCTPWEGLNLPGAMADLAESVLISTNGFISVLSRSPEDCCVQGSHVFAVAGAGQLFVPSAVTGAEHSNAGSDGHLGLATVALAERSEGRAFFFPFS